MTDQAMKATANTTADMHGQMAELAKTKGPTFFKLRTRLPVQGRADTLMAASDTMSVVLKTYAQAGENGLHRHPNEDHVFVVLQGTAEFHGPNDEMRVVGKHEGVFLPDTALYWFKAGEGEPLVMLRVGSDKGHDGDVLERLDIHGKPVDGNSTANKEVELIYGDSYFG
ncbi:Mannose-6-phosphate isomerase, cupin superfamily [Bosea sp. OK403]|uniref:cupin domain-containing protein n=1 Tax=Bosea sp. OK403 TaxID=1855286 RepID=UPI0008E47776|nr:cupin domain-containing protein [Bosea sp. OK403]SFI04426.1 Mannose-6-phosphate isomerase, cupin superfamily [Bosea sp. OK403]